MPANDSQNGSLLAPLQTPSSPALSRYDGVSLGAENETSRIPDSSWRYSAFMAD